MALNSSGPISLAGSTVGQSIAEELGESPTGTISLNDAAVRDLAEVASGAIVMPTNFYGKASIPNPGVAIGAAYGGGYYGGLLVSGGVYYFLVIAPLSTGGTTNKKYQSNTSSVSGADSTINGAQNTADLIAAGTTHDAATFCNNLSIGGYSDWYLPAKNELEMLYYNFKPTTESNRTSPASGANGNAVPSRSNYTTGDPTQTSVSVFQTGGSEAFFDGIHWSSTETAFNAASGQRFDEGQQENLLKTARNRVRAVRKVIA